MKAQPNELDAKLKEAGYKFLGWQNGWKHIYVMKDGHKTFDYAEADYPEYIKCRDLKHKKDSVQHNPRGSENTVSCDECRIYYKYDCSD